MPYGIPFPAPATPLRASPSADCDHINILQCPTGVPVAGIEFEAHCTRCGSVQPR